MHELQLYNTVTRRTEPFTPREPNAVGLYTCGPTVYQFAHLGNFRTFLFGDLLRRVLEYQGLAVNHVMNITDVGHLVGDGDTGEDKVAKSAAEQGKTAWEIASYYTEAFLSDLDRLNLERPHVLPRATQHIPEQLLLIQALEAKGFTYTTTDGVYFDTSKLPDYGKLTGQDMAELEAGARVEVNAAKRHPADFALWKLSPAGDQRQMEWDSPWGVGFPGWHLECSAMSVKYLGQPFDLHTGGVDHIFPHHTNEIAQTEAATGEPLAMYWLHGAFMSVDGQRMGKSLGNTYTVDDLVERGHDPLAFRYLTLQTHYRKPLNFTWEAVAGAEQALNRLRALARSLPDAEGATPEQFEQAFRAVIGNDLGIPEALGLVWEWLKREDVTPGQQAAILRHADQVFGLRLVDELGKGESEAAIEIPAEIQAHVDEREQARQAGDFAKADALRDQIADAGFTVRDTPDGPVVTPLPEHPTKL
ncbi:cysteine--tRNA ligase [Candidatus Berkelbacteria bacterium]|nr:cysteine--tRNA ligase [Candidatus Berkelbacteria bacterium]